MDEHSGLDLHCVAHLKLFTCMSRLITIHNLRAWLLTVECHPLEQEAGD